MKTISLKQVHNHIKDYITNSTQKKITIWLSGGRSLDTFYPLFDNLIMDLDSFQREKLMFCFLDERVVPLDDPESNYHSVYEKFFSKLIDKSFITWEQIATLDIKNKSIAKDYAKRVPSLDIALFGVGEDGHIASLFPHHNLLMSQENNFVEILDSPKNPPHRITITPKMIETFDLSFVFFVGEGKKQARELFKDDSITYEELPAKLVQKSKKRYTIVS